MKAASEVKRPYQSILRGAQAQSTREAVIAAAARLFAEDGYAATSIDAIAAAAGVSRATVFASVGGKAKLLKTALDVAIVGDEQTAPPRGGSRQGAGIVLVGRKDEAADHGSSSRDDGRRRAHRAARPPSLQSDSRRARSTQIPRPLRRARDRDRRPPGGHP